MEKPLDCNKAGCPGQLESYMGTLVLEGLTIVDVPVLVCSICKTRILTDEVVRGINYQLAEAKDCEERTKNQIAKAFKFLERFTQ